MGELPSGYSAAQASVSLPRGGNTTPKSKTPAVLLAVFLSYWTWLYTYRDDGWKFWLALGIGGTNLILFIAISMWIIPMILVGVGLWAWAIIDTASKSDQWYESY